MRKLPGVKITVHPNRKYKVQKVKMKRKAISLLSVAIYFLFAKSQPQKDLKVDNFKKKSSQGNILILLLDFRKIYDIFFLTCY